MCVFMMQYHTEGYAQTAPHAQINRALLQLKSTSTCTMYIITKNNWNRPVTHLHLISHFLNIYRPIYFYALKKQQQTTETSGTARPSTKAPPLWPTPLGYMKCRSLGSCLHWLASSEACNLIGCLWGCCSVFGWAMEKRSTSSLFLVVVAVFFLHLYIVFTVKERTDSPLLSVTASCLPLSY